MLRHMYLFEFLYKIVEWIAEVHSYLMRINDSYEYHFSDKELHFIVIGLLGMLFIFIVYEILFELVKDMDHFILTTNVDYCFQKAGFDKKRLFYTQGDYGLLQCSEPCCQETLDNKQVIMNMVKQQENMKIPHELIPYVRIAINLW